MDIAHKVVELQSEMVSPNISHLKQVNALLKKALSASPLNGLHFAPLSMPLRVVGVSDCGHATKRSSYAYEGKIVMMMSDHIKDSSAEWLPARLAQRLLAGKGHPLFFSARRATRVSHSTSHAETLSCVGCSQVAILIATRLTEIYAQLLLPGVATLRAHHLLQLQDQNMCVLPVDQVTDCMDLFELVTNVRGLSNDKAQRLAILALREDRIMRRIRNFVHVPTKGMLADGLTKEGVFEQLLYYATTGRWQLNLADDQWIRVRSRAACPTQTVEERELLELDW